MLFIDREVAELTLDTQNAQEEARNKYVGVGKPEILSGGLFSRAFV